MNWLEWLKKLGNRRPETATVVSRKAGRAARKGGEAYAREWVKVLEDSSPRRDPFNTYTWDLKTEPMEPQKPVAAASKKRADAPPTDPFDSFTWEVPETDSRDDPWGLQQDAEPPKVAQKDGVNPYDTGVFEAGWTGRFDQR